MGSEGFLVGWVLLQSFGNPVFLMHAITLAKNNALKVGFNQNGSTLISILPLDIQSTLPRPKTGLALDLKVHSKYIPKRNT